MTPSINLRFILISVIIILVGCKEKDLLQEGIQSGEMVNLKNAFSDDFFLGAAINDAVINEKDTLATDVVKREFNSISPENIMKWKYLHHTPDSFYFDMADNYVALGERGDMHILGHTLVWHSQIADWMNQVKDSATMAAHLENHINTIVGRYKGRINSWDVVNEALNEDGTLRESLFLKVLGEVYIEQAFKSASKSDLFYHDSILSKGVTHLRSVKVAEIKYRSDGAIETIDHLSSAIR